MSAPARPSVSLRRGPNSQSAVSLTLWMLRYGLRRWPGMLAMLGTMLLTAGIEVLRPWPLKILVDNVLGGKPLPPSIAPLAGVLPGAATTEGQLLWTVAATVLLFLLGWLLGVATVYAGIGFGQRLSYDLAEDLFAHLQ